jgi:hypothetical protein
MKRKKGCCGCKNAQTVQVVREICACRARKSSVGPKAGAKNQVHNGDWDALCGPITWPGSAKKRALINQLFSKGDD